MATLNQFDLEKAILIAIKSDNIPFISGSPGIGKSAIIQSIARKLNYKLIDLRLTQLQPYDLAGLITPYKNDKDEIKATYSPLEYFPLENEELPDGKQGFLLFLDEFNSADKYTLAAAYKLLLDRKIGENKLHPSVRIVCAGNLMTDNAIAHNLPTPIVSRITHLHLKNPGKEWIDWVIEQNNWSDSIISFLSYQPQYISNFDALMENDTDFTTFACPRTWKMLSDQLNNGLLDSFNLKKGTDKTVLRTIIDGIIGEQASNDFISFLKYADEIPTTQQIVSNPQDAKIPSKEGAYWALMGQLVSCFREYRNESDKINNLIMYINRIENNDIKVLTYKRVKKIFPELDNFPLFREEALKIIKYMNE